MSGLLLAALTATSANAAAPAEDTTPCCCPCPCWQSPCRKTTTWQHARGGAAVPARSTVLACCHFSPMPLQTLPPALTHHYTSLGVPEERWRCRRCGRSTALTMQVHVWVVLIVGGGGALCPPPWTPLHLAWHTCCSFTGQRVGGTAGPRAASHAVMLIQTLQDPPTCPDPPLHIPWSARGAVEVQALWAQYCADDAGTCVGGADCWWGGSPLPSPLDPFAPSMAHMMFLHWAARRRHCGTPCCQPCCHAHPDPSRPSHLS